MVAVVQDEQLVQLQKTLCELNYTEKLTQDSLPLVRHLLFDYYEVIRRFNGLQTNDLDESYIFKVVDLAKNQNEHLNEELARLNLENEQLKNQVIATKPILAISCSRSHRPSWPLMTCSGHSAGCLDWAMCGQRILWKKLKS